LRFGDVYLALALWHGTGLADLCRRLLPVGKEQVAWEKIATVLVAARLCEPSSELHIAKDWFRRTALGDLLELSDEEVNKDRLRALDLLLERKAALEAHLSKRCGEPFSIENEVLLYDGTSTYFEGLAEGNPLAQRGYSRDHRPDCKQVLIAPLVTFDGFPLGYEVFAGNVLISVLFRPSFPPWRRAMARWEGSGSPIAAWRVLRILPGCAAPKSSSTEM